MSGKEICDIILNICFFGWIPISVLCMGISIIIDSIKGNKKD